jgi:hypothetical protein
MFQWGRRFALLLLCAAMAYISIASYLTLRVFPQYPASSAFEVIRMWLPWGGPAWLRAGQQAIREWVRDPQAVDTLLQAIASRYPLDPYLWLERAQAASAMGKAAERVLGFVDVATAVRPWDTEINWRAATLALQVGHTGTAEHYLKRYLQAQPHEVGKVVLLARRWLPEPAAVIARVVPPGAAYMKVLLRTACRWEDEALAAHVWAQLPAEMKADVDTVVPYVQYLLRANQGRRATVVWRWVKPNYVPGTLFNGDFSQLLDNRGGLDWGVTAPEGVTITRDTDQYVSAPASLKIAFDGKHNINLASPIQYIPVRPGGRYRLSGHWAGQGLTTRSLPLVMVTSYPKGEVLGKVSAPVGSSWTWEPFSLVFEVPKEISVIFLSVRRFPTDNLDRFIGGVLYIDDLTLALDSEAV